MKKYLLACSIALISISISAQTLSVIPKIGITVSTISMEETDNVPFPGFEDEIKSKIGFTIGAALNYSINDRISIQPELNFIQKGYTQKSNSTWTEDDDGRLITTVTTSTTKNTLNYLEIPTLVKISFGGDTKFYVLAGPSFGIGLGGKYTNDSKITESYDDVSDTFKNSDKGNIKFGDRPENAEGIYIDNRLDFGLQLGGGILIARKILIEARYGLGLSNLYDSENNPETKNRVFQLTAGIPLTLR